jgi:hypothetical protein
VITIKNRISGQARQNSQCNDFGDERVSRFRHSFVLRSDRV